MIQNDVDSRSLDMRLRREIGRKSLGEEEGGEVLGIGITIDFFQGDGKEPVEIDKLNICFNGSTMEWAVDLSSKDEILSGPVEVWLGREEIKFKMVSDEQRRSSLQCREVSRGGIEMEDVSQVKKLEKALFRRFAFAELEVTVVLC